MLVTALLFAAISGTDLDQPVSAVDAVNSALLARLPEYFATPDQIDPETAALFATPVAKVNGRAILAGTILERYDLELQHLQHTLSPEKYAKSVHDIIRTNLPHAIIRQIVSHEAETHFSAEEQVGMRQQLEFKWKKEKMSLARELAGNTPQYLIRVSLDDIRETFFQEEMARAYLRVKIYGQRSEKINDYFRQIPENAKIETAYSVDFRETYTR